MKVHELSVSGGFVERHRMRCIYKFVVGIWSRLPAQLGSKTELSVVVLFPLCIDK